MKKILLVGLGRIGRAFARIYSERKNLNFSISGIMDPSMNVSSASYFLKFDSLYGKYDFSHSKENLIINNSDEKKIAKFFQTGSVLEVVKSLSEIDMVVDCSGTQEVINDIKSWLSLNSAKALVSRCLEDSDFEAIFGFNHLNIKKEDKLISASICDANGLVHILDAINKEYGILSGSVTTIHPWLSYQNLMDGPVASEIFPGSNIINNAIGRAANASMIPKNTSALSACEKLIPEIKGKIMSMSFRSPTDVVSVASLSISIKKTITKEDLVKFINVFFSKAENIEIVNEDVVTIDFKKSSMSCVIDLRWVEVNHNTIRIVLYYDNEWGYTTQLVNLCDFITKI